jgi:predicted transcriptional regulator
MTEREFLRLNDELHRRQVRISEERKRSEPVHIREILLNVMRAIRQRTTGKEGDF